MSPSPSVVCCVTLGVSRLWRDFWSHRRWVATPKRQRREAFADIRCASTTEPGTVSAQHLSLAKQTVHVGGSREANDPSQEGHLRFIVHQDLEHQARCSHTRTIQRWTRWHTEYGINKAPRPNGTRGFIMYLLKQSSKLENDLVSVLLHGETVTRDFENNFLFFAFLRRHFQGVLIAFTLLEGVRLALRLSSPIMDIFMLMFLSSMVTSIFKLSRKAGGISLNFGSTFAISSISNFQVPFQRTHCSVLSEPALFPDAAVSRTLHWSLIFRLIVAITGLLVLAGASEAGWVNLSARKTAVKRTAKRIVSSFLKFILRWRAQAIVPLTQHTQRDGTLAPEES